MLIEVFGKVSVYAADQVGVLFLFERDTLDKLLAVFAFSAAAAYL